MEYPNFLSIRERGKGIPYPGSGVPRDDGEANHGFRNLKSSPLDLSRVPELTADHALRDLVQTMNAGHTGVFSVGCVSGPAHDEKMGHRYTGYIEFALNSVREVQDARYYFPAFFYFNKLLHREQFREVKFDWQLEGASYTDVDVGGFSCAVFVNTEFKPTGDEAYRAWSRALGYLAMLFDDVPAPGDPIYEPPELAKTEEA